MKRGNDKVAKEWFEKASSDLMFAKASFEDFDEFYSQICILCHDSAEKYLKGFLIFKATKPERTHDLVTLLNNCIKLMPSQKEISDLEEGCRTLNSYYIPLKYPSHFPPCSKKQAKEAVEIAETIEAVISNLA